MDGYKNKEDIIKHAKLLEGKSAGLWLTQRNIGNWVKLRGGEVFLPKEEHANWLFSDKPSFLKTHKSHILWTEQVIVRNI